MSDHAAFQKRLDEARKQAGEPLTREQVAEIVASALATMSGDMTSADLKIYSEVEALARYIQNAKNEIASMREEALGGEIPSATDQLDAVVGATEDATNKIMDCCDKISEIAGTLPEDKGGELINVVTNIYEACNFQDITGQRITKVVRTLKHIEGQVSRILQAFGESTGQPLPKAQEFDPENPEKHLLNGPQLPGNAIDQDEIDKLMASFDQPAK